MLGSSQPTPCAHQAHARHQALLQNPVSL